MKLNKSLILVFGYFIYLLTLRIFINIIWGHWLESHIPQNILGEFVWVGIKFLHWCLPIIVYLLLKKDLTGFIKRNYSFSFNKTKVGIFILIWILLILLEHGFKVGTSGYKLIDDVIATALIEEFVFRGFVLNELLKSVNFVKSNLIQSFFFSINHLPWLFTLGIFGDIFLLSKLLIFYILFGLITGYMTKKTNSLVPATVLHAVNNFFA
jgi:membrane protease YdiL (CAAX protease family)